MFAVSLQTASPGSFDLTLSLALLSAAVIGGLGSLTGAVWGSIVVVYLGIILRGFVDNLGLSAASAQKLHDNLPNAVYGLLLVVVMLALPGGIQGCSGGWPGWSRSGAAPATRSRRPTAGRRAVRRTAFEFATTHRRSAMTATPDGAIASSPRSPPSPSSGSRRAAAARRAAPATPPATPAPRASPATSILLGTTQPLTGPAAPGYSKISAAMTAYFKYANAQGGVNGRKITLKVLDDGYNPANTATTTRQLVLQDKVFALLGALGTPTHTAVLDFIKTNKVPDLFVSSGSRSWDQPAKYPTTFGWQPDYTVEGKILGDYVKKNFSGKKVCSFGQGDDFGTDGVAGRG